MTIETANIRAVKRLLQVSGCLRENKLNEKSIQKREKSIGIYYM